MTRQNKYRGHLFNFSTLFITSFFLLVALEYFSRTFLIESTYLPGKKIMDVQSHLKLDSLVGFLWNGNINYCDSIMLPWSDQIISPLSTDSNGFRNHPDAIFSKRKVNIIGLGDSFIHDASYLFYEYFSNEGLQYYNLAMHRHSPPQYNLILKKYALSKNPDLIIYGVYENDFGESVDFIDWKNSNIDWFEYHSGIWGGPTTIDYIYEPYSIPYFKGIYAFYRLMYDKFRKKTNNDNSIKGMEIVFSEISEAFRLCKANNTNFVLLLIPSKETMLNEKLENNYDILVERLNQIKIHIIDLRTYFNSYSNIEKLYYKIDGHWNENGIHESAKIINSYIKELKQEIN